MNVLFIASEVAPLSKTGGLADVAGALPRALAAEGVRPVVVSPCYGTIDPARFSLARRLRTLPVPLGEDSVEVGIYEGRLPGGAVPIYLVDHPPSFARAGLYGQDGADYPDNARRFALLSRAALEIARSFAGWPDVVHAHDWQAALACFYLKRGLLAGAPPTGAVLTIHNLAFLGLAPKEVVGELGLGWDAFTPDGLEFYGQVSLLKAGLVWSDRLTTVSARYAREIQTPEYGCGLDGLLRSQGRKLQGILNGVDYDVWDPAHDRLLPHRYSAADLAAKAECKRELQRRFGLAQRGDVLLLGSVSRLTDQKGFDLVAAAGDQLARMDLQYVLLGSGDRQLEQRLQTMAARHPSRLAVKLAYDESLSHLIEAGADAFLMPSRFEPCGLNQMYSLRYGTLPIVRATGGLDDTVVDFDAPTRSGTGFKFDEATPQALVEAVGRAVRDFADQEAWRAGMTNAMQQDYSWRASARQYAYLYEDVVREISR
jgi:starch synthase